MGVLKEDSFIHFVKESDFYSIGSGEHRKLSNRLDMWSFSLQKVLCEYEMDLVGFGVRWRTRGL